VIRDGADGRVRAEPGVFEEADEATFGVVMYLHHDAVGAIGTFCHWDPIDEKVPHPDTANGFEAGNFGGTYTLDTIAVAHAPSDRRTSSSWPSAQPANAPAEVAPAEYLEPV
jgi:hypothetical protein